MPTGRALNGSPSRQTIPKRLVRYRYATFFVISELHRFRTKSNVEIRRSRTYITSLEFKFRFIGGSHDRVFTLTEFNSSTKYYKVYEAKASVPTLERQQFGAWIRFKIGYSKDLLRIKQLPSRIDVYLKVRIQFSTPHICLGHFFKLAFQHHFTLQASIAKSQFQKP